MSQILRTAFADAELLLIHAVRGGLTVPQTIVDDIVQTESLLAGAGLTDAQKAQFWASFGELARLVCPVTVSSLRATTDTTTPARNRLYALLQRLGLAHECTSLARRAVLSYTVLTIWAAALLLILQVYWLFGVTLTSDIHALKDQQGVIRTQLSATTLERDQARASGWKKGRTENEIAFAMKQLDDVKQALALNRESTSNMLRTWSVPWDGTWAIRETCTDGNQIDTSRRDQCEHAARLQAAEVVLENLQRYGLPLMYGLLGACVFTLRTLANQIRARSYSESSNIDFRIRLCLGTLGGLVSAWFLIPGTPGTTDTMTSNISPFALAFLSGYSIELVFAAMDRFITAFTSKA